MEYYVVCRKSRNSEMIVVRVIGKNRDKIRHALMFMGYLIVRPFTLTKLLEIQNMEISAYNEMYGKHRIPNSFIKDIHFDKFYETYNLSEIPTKINLAF